MSNTKKGNKKKIILWVVVILLISCVIVPIFINLLFKQHGFPDFMVVDWTSADALQYAGTVLSFLGTIFLGAITVKLSRDANKLNEKLINIEKDREQAKKLDLYIQYSETFHRIFEIDLLMSSAGIRKSTNEVTHYVFEIWSECERLQQRIRLLADDDTEYEIYEYFENIIKDILQKLSDKYMGKDKNGIIGEIKKYDTIEFREKVKSFIKEAERNLKGGNSNE